MAALQVCEDPLSMTTCTSRSGATAMLPGRGVNVTEFMRSPLGP